MEAGIFILSPSVLRTYFLPFSSTLFPLILVFMKSFLSILLIIQATNASAIECQPPGAGHLESRIKETFYGEASETELKEWMTHPSNYEVRQSLKNLDRRIKFTPQRLDREALLGEMQVKFDQAIQNTGRPSTMDNFPANGTQSKMTGSEGALTIEVTNLAKEDLDLLPKEVLDKLEPKVKIHYYYPYEKFEYLLTYDGKEQPMHAALLKVQKDMEYYCEKRMIDNRVDRGWIQKHYSGDSKGQGASGGAGKTHGNAQ